MNDLNFLNVGQHCFAAVPCTTNDIVQVKETKPDSEKETKSDKEVVAPAPGKEAKTEETVLKQEAKTEETVLKQEEELQEESKSYSSYAMVLSVIALTLFAGIVYWRCKSNQNTETLKLYRPLSKVEPA